ncbi:MULTISPECIES: energy transducer TonB [unclassified Sphingomonas]|uniref:energy transducer TonB n=1 Tax=unclassified Sphingomonas TaxID=196159 RepID=UPI0009E66E33|nr:MULTISPECIES: TonB family protein [unclassified Sphingomonas]
MTATLPDRTKGTALAVTIGLHVLLGWALIIGLGVDIPRAAQGALATFDILPPPPDPPPPPPVPQVVRQGRPEGRAAPPNIRSKATEIVATPPVVPLPVPPPVVAAPVAGPGNDASSGATDTVGPGTGAGGIGDGLGSGGAGDGDGSGGGDTPPEQIGGSLQGARLPPDLEENGFEGTVEVDYVVEPNGRATDCRIRRSSGNRAIDLATCRQIERAFRFRPSRDGRGQPVASVMVQRHEWDVERE